MSGSYQQVEPPGSLQTCKEIFKEAQDCLNVSWPDDEWTYNYVQSVLKTQQCDHIYDMSPLRTHLRDTMNALDEDMLKDPLKYKGNLELVELISNTQKDTFAKHILYKIKRKHQVELSCARWRVWHMQNVELFQGVYAWLGSG